MGKIETVSIFSNGAVVLFDEQGQQAGSGRINAIELVLRELQRNGIDIFSLKEIWTMVNGVPKFVVPKEDEGGLRLSFVDF